MSTKAADALARAQHGWPASYPMVQFPNAPLAVAEAAFVVELLADDAVADYALAVHLAGMSVWAWQEVTAGANAFRRVLGVAGVAYVAVRLSAAVRG